MEGKAALLPVVFDNGGERDPLFGNTAVIRALRDKDDDGGDKSS